ncbi:MAG: hypothetical protein ACQCN4_10380 [Candidatus Bathyarchaeia archaeon]
MIVLLNNVFTIMLFESQKYSKETVTFQSAEDPIMTKGLPWTVEEEIQLKKLIQAKTPLSAIAATLGRTAQAVLVKCQRLGLEPIGHETTLTLPLPADLPSVEETLKKLAGALEAASTPGLSRVEVERLQVVATLARAYKDILSDYLNYREVEAKLNDMEAKYAALLESKSQNNAPQAVPADVAKTPAQ